MPGLVLRELWGELAFLQLVMGTGLRTRAGLRVRVTRVRVRVTKLLPVTFPYPFRRVTGMSRERNGCHITTVTQLLPPTPSVNPPENELKRSFSTPGRRRKGTPANYYLISIY